MSISPNGRQELSQKRVIQRYDLIADPLFYGTLIFFALLTTGLAGLMGQVNFMPVLQSLGLTIFLAIPIRRGRIGAALQVAAVWLVVQFFIFTLVSALFPVQAERAISGAFLARTDYIEWAVTGGLLPGGLLASPLSRVLEFLVLTVGSIVSGGLIGSFVLVRAVNNTAYLLGAFWRQSQGAGILLVLAPWRLAQLAGYTGLLILFAQPILLNIWRPAYYLRTQRTLVTLSFGLVLLGVILELILPGYWRTILPLR